MFVLLIFFKHRYQEWLSFEAELKRTLPRDFLPPCVVGLALGPDAEVEWASEVQFTSQGPSRRFIPVIGEVREPGQRVKYDHFRLTMLDYIIRHDWSLESAFSWVSMNVDETPLALLQLTRYFNGDNLLRTAIRNNWGRAVIVSHIETEELRRRYTQAPRSVLYQIFSCLDIHPEHCPVGYARAVVIAFLGLVQHTSGEGVEVGVANFVTSDRLQSGPGGLLHVLTGVGHHSSKGGVNTGRMSAAFHVSSFPFF